MSCRTLRPLTLAACAIAVQMCSAAACSPGDYVLASRQTASNSGGTSSTTGSGGGEATGGAIAGGSAGAGGVAQADLTDGLVLYLPFDRDLEDVAGAREASYVPESGELTAYGTGVLSECLDLRETQGHVTLAYEESLTPEDFTLAFWARSSLPEQPFQQVFTGIGRDCLSSYFCGVYPDATVKCAINDGRGWCDDAIVLDAPWTEGRFVHVAFVIEQDAAPPLLHARLYLDGVLVDEEDHEDYFRVTDPGRPFVVGAHYMETDSGGIAPYFAEAEIDELRLYDRPLSAEEVWLLFEAGGV